MKSSFQCTVQQQTFPKTEDWHVFATACGMESTFFRGPRESHLEQHTTCFTLFINGELCAVAPHFTRSHECGLWVAPSRRGLGLGRLALSHLLAHTTTQLHGSVSQDNPHAAAMEHLFNASGFRSYLTVHGYRFWRYLPASQTMPRAALQLHSPV